MFVGCPPPSSVKFISGGSLKRWNLRRVGSLCQLHWHSQIENNEKNCFKKNSNELKLFVDNILQIVGYNFTIPINFLKKFMQKSRNQ